MHYDPADYIYASARVRAMEERLLGRDKQAALLDMSENELENALSRGEIPAAEDEALLLEAFDTIERSLSDPSLIKFLRYPYDCHNLKVIEKCRAKGEDPAPLLSRLGSIPLELLLSPPEKGLRDLLPTHLAAALDEARDAFSKTGDPQTIDLTLDRAVFADMEAGAAEIPFAAEWLKKKAELTNLTVCLRLLQMGGGELGRALLQSAALPVGSYQKEALLALYDGGEDAFFEALAKSPYAKVFEQGERLAVIEKRADDHLMEHIKKARRVTYGADVPLAYLLALETERKNLRILLSGKRAGLDRDTISSRMRESYV